MDWMTLASFLATVAVFGVVIWRQQRLIEHMSGLLAARSYGEYANGQSRMAKVDQPPSEINLF